MAKDTLAMGLEAVFETFTQNVYVFDFFHKLVNPYYIMLLQYMQVPYDSHLNIAKITLVAPQFVKEIFNHAIIYENIYGIENGNTFIPGIHLYQNYPNQYNFSTVIKYLVDKRTFVYIKVYDLLGKVIRTLIKNKNKDTYLIEWKLSNKPIIIYFSRMLTDKGYSVYLNDLYEISAQIIF